ncbi:MAG TPA: hypothetical protein VGO57_05245 [Verrucomicrobiae bacterium]|jgi:hypothetical protein
MLKYFLCPPLVAGTLALNTFNSSAAGTYAPMPVAITSFGAVTQSGWLYVYGGHKGKRHEYSSNEVSGAFVRLNLADGKTWEALPAAAPAQSPVFVADANFIYRIGGMAARNPEGQPNDVWSHDTAARFDLRTREWLPLPKLPAARSSHDGWIVDGKLYVIGGWNLCGDESAAIWATNALMLDLHSLNAQWQEIPQPFQRRGLCVAALGKKLYAIGGMDSDASPTLAVSVLDTETGKWSDGPPLPAGKLKGFGNSACVVAGKLYVSGMSGIVWRLNVQADGWEEAGKLAAPRFFHRLVPGADHQILALGGESDEGKLRNIEIISLNQSTAKNP